jgi:phytoene dehydrogenase-like protein
MPDVAIIGGGHNGLVCAAYLARKGANVTVLERRERVGGACVTEELWPGYKVSRAAYVVSLFRPVIAKDLELAKHGLELLPRTPSSITPLPDGRSLVLGADAAQNAEEIGRFSTRDAEAFPRYEAMLGRIAAAIEPTLDLPPPDPTLGVWRDRQALLAAVRAAWQLRGDVPNAARVLLAPARELLCEWFDSEPLRATLATDAVIGAFAAPSAPGTGYVLFHHVMGSLTGTRGVWAYVRGGMGALSDALAKAATAAGAEIRCGVEVARVRTHEERACAVVLADGEELPVDAAISSLDPARSLKLLEGTELPEDFTRALDQIDYRSPVVKLNLALNRLPTFRVSDRDEVPLQGTIHLGSETLDTLELAFDDARAGRVSARPVVELTIPSVLDSSLAPEGHHVASIFAQYAPARPFADPEWPTLREQMHDRVLAMIDELAPGFSESIEHIEVLTPPDLERIFSLTGGNIFHGAMTPDRLLFMRPAPGFSRHRTPVPGFYLCGSGTHPGGGVMGAPGRNAALEIARDLTRR